MDRSRKKLRALGAIQRIGENESVTMEGSKDLGRHKADFFAASDQIKTTAQLASMALSNSLPSNTLTRMSESSSHTSNPLTLRATEMCTYSCCSSSRKIIWGKRAGRARLSLAHHWPY